MNDLVKINVPSLAMSEQELMKVLQTSLYPGAELESIKLVIAWCKASNKDPMKRPVHIVPMQVKQKVKNKDGQPTNKTEYVWRDVIMPGVGDYRTDAARTGEYAGISQATFGSDVEKELGGSPIMEWSDDAHAKVDTGRKHPTVKFRFPEWCELSVFRLVGGTRCEFSSGRVYFEETYATQSKDNDAPNAMWKKRPRGQLEKCAEAMALRRAFPEVGAQPTADEMAGKTLDDGAKIIDHESGEIVTNKLQVEGPKAKSAVDTSDHAAGGQTIEAKQAEGAVKLITPGGVRILTAKIKGFAAAKEIAEEEAIKQVLASVKAESLAAMTTQQANQAADWLLAELEK